MKDYKEIESLEESEYSVIPGKTITLSPIAQGISEKLTYSWDSKMRGVNNAHY